MNMKAYRLPFSCTELECLALGAFNEFSPGLKQWQQDLDGFVPELVSDSPRNAFSSLLGSSMPITPLDPSICLIASMSIEKTVEENCLCCCRKLLLMLSSTNFDLPYIPKLHIDSSISSACV